MLQVILCCLVITTVVQSLEIHLMKKTIDMLAEDVWYIEENQQNENNN